MTPESLERKKATFEVTNSFTGGSGIMLEALEIADEPERFVQTFTRLTGR
jgi:hypothetical protein